jgi:hypothetical protein
MFAPSSVFTHWNYVPICQINIAAVFDTLYLRFEIPTAVAAKGHYRLGSNSVQFDRCP